MAGSLPAGRAAHSACLIEPGGSIVVFGGTNGQRPFDELWLLHVGSSRWEQLRLPSSLHKPTARSYHSAAVVGGEMLLWGGVRPGRDEGCSISAGSDVHVFNLERRSWSLHLVSDETHLVGGGRSSHTAVAHRDKVLIIGGKLATLKGRKELGTDRPAHLLAFDMGGRAWLPPPSVETCEMAARSGHTATLVSLASPRVLLIGGYLGCHMLLSCR